MYVNCQPTCMYAIVFFNRVCTTLCSHVTACSFTSTNNSKVILMTAFTTPNSFVPTKIRTLINR